MSISLDEFYTEFFQEIITDADAGGKFMEDAFFDHFTTHLIDSGELDAADRVAFVKPGSGMRVDGYGGDPLSTEGTLNLIVMDFNQSDTISRITQTEMNASFKRLHKFVEKSTDTKFRNGMEESSPAFGLADLINNRWGSVFKIRMFLLSNRQLSARVDGRDAEEIEGKLVTYNVWDLERLYRYVTAGHGREEIVIDLKNEYGGAIPVLYAHQPDASYESYLAVVPGEQLASIYDRWGARLLEQNVRVFLQARGNVNKGIRNTIENDPEMFFAYNNGITATADSVNTINTNDGVKLVELNNLQIVNGGQTTASIHAAYRKKVDLSKVYVQMKLSIVGAERASEVVPKISEYANSQNKVNAADFFANHPYHVRIEDFSRRIYAPSSEGTFRESKWFYERARGQYQDARGQLTPAQRKKFELEYPKKQLFTKTDLAKYINVWSGHPDIVSKGAQKNFAHFAQVIGKEWEKHANMFNESYYRSVVAKAIVFRATEKIVTDQAWYQGGYRANIVAYTISKLAHDVAEGNQAIDFEKIWKSQKLSDSMVRAIEVCAKDIHDILIDPPSGLSNVTEWAKQQACWSRIKEIKIDWPPKLFDEIISKEEQKERDTDAVKDQRVLNGIEAQTAVVNAGSRFWKDVLEWGSERQLLTQSESGILTTAASIPMKLPTEKQSIRVIEILTKLNEEGCQLSLVQ